jgi:hypothetical protein
VERIAACVVRDHPARHRRAAAAILDTGHAAISGLLILSLVLGWRDRPVRRMLLIGLASYAVMRGWSFAYFIPEMLAFQEVPLDARPTEELLRRVENWTFWTVFREPLDVISFACYLFALRAVGKVGHPAESPDPPVPAASHA